MSLNPLRYLKEKIIDKLSLSNPQDVKPLTVLGHDMEALILAVGYQIAKEDDPLGLRDLLDEWLKLRIAVGARARKDIKEVYMHKVLWSERPSFYGIYGYSPIQQQEQGEQVKRKRRWL